ncbi:MAG: FHA domain-containing protein [Aggregatilineales bacterium]
MPNIDLADQEGDSVGVSRLHLALRYDARYHTISVFDMGSANDTYINGQRLHAHEVRVLCDGDELRLGRLALAVSFRHPA